VIEKSCRSQNNFRIVIVVIVKFQPSEILMLVILFHQFILSTSQSIRADSHTIISLRHREIRGSPNIDYCDLDREDLEDFIDDCEEEDCTVIECTSPGSLADTTYELACIKEFCRKVCTLEDLRGCPDFSTETIAVIVIILAIMMGLFCSVIALCYCCCISQSPKPEPQDPIAAPFTASEYAAYPVPTGVEGAGYGEIGDSRFPPVYGYPPPMYGTCQEPYGYSVQEYPPQYPQ
jgi:hypothetical protein